MGSCLLRPPPWEVLVLVSHCLDHKSLAIACCVCKSWFISMSSDHLWRPICATHFPSIANLQLLTTNPTVSYRRLYAIAYASSKRRLKSPSKPHLSLHDLVFAVNISTTSSPNAQAALAVPGDELAVDPDGVFKFDFKVNNCERINNYASTAESDSSMGQVKISWHVVLKGWKGVFAMMDCEGKMSFSPGAEGWFSEELPSPGCCSGGDASGVVADVKVGFCSRRECRSNGGIVRIEKVSLGILSVVSWRYVSVNDGLRYLQHFLLPLDA